MTARRGARKLQPHGHGRGRAIRLRRGRHVDVPVVAVASRHRDARERRLALLRLLGALPPNRSAALFRTITGFAVVESSLWIVTQILSASMLAAVVFASRVMHGY